MARTGNKIVFDLTNRQLGILSAMNFHARTSGSCVFVKRLSLHHKLEHHKRCVNTLHFNGSGDLLASGSDDLGIAIWDWAKGEKKMTYESGHNIAVHQAKFRPFMETNILSCGGDGMVLLDDLSSGQVLKGTQSLVPHEGAAYMLAMQPDSANEFLTCGEDGAVFHVDLRKKKPHKLFQLREVPLFTICSNPQKVSEFAVGGGDQFARIYDRRKSGENSNDLAELVGKYCPHHLRGGGDVHANIACLVYSYNGTELLVNYRNENIYLFDSYASPEAEYVKRYKGHRNNETFTNVNFFGRQSKYVVRGSDCSHIFLWDKQTEEVVQCLQGDNTRVDICLAPHPRELFLATSGFDHDIKLWLPTAKQPIHLDGLQKAMSQNDPIREDDRQSCHNPASKDRRRQDICLEPHPHAPVLATSGFDHNIKLQLPTAEQPTDLDGLQKAMSQNDPIREDAQQGSHNPASKDRRRQGLSKCFICLEEGWNMPSSACCGQPRHEKCEKRFRRTLASITNVCAHCRHLFEDPCDPLTEARIHDIMALYKTHSCPVMHPEEEISWTCIICCFFFKAQTKFHKLDIFKLMNKILNCPCENGPCDRCAKAYGKLCKFYLNEEPF